MRQVPEESVRFSLRSLSEHRFVIVHSIMQSYHFRVIQQRAGEWLLKQLNQTKNSDGSVDLTKDALLSVDGKI